MKPADRGYTLRSQLAAHEDDQRLARMRQKPETAEARYFVPLARDPAYSVDLAKIQNQL